jgi:hypothetical protein
MDKHHSNLLIVFCLVASAIIVFFVFLQKGQAPGVLSSPSPVPLAVAKAQPVINQSSVTSPDGKFILTMKYNEEGNSTVYRFWLKDKEKGTENEVFNKTEPMGVKMSIPANTFSSDNKYVFLKETGAGATNYLVLKDSQVLEVPILFAQSRYSSYVITDVTGWAAPTLLVINTNKSDGTIGPSFWLDISTKSFILLADRFN